MSGELRAGRSGDIHESVTWAANTLDLDFGFNVRDCLVMPRQGTVTVKGVTVRLEPKVMGVLIALAKRGGEVVRREEFLDEVWPGVVVGDEVLNRSISILRGHFDDDSAEPRYIQTVPKVGYRLVAPVTLHRHDARERSRIPHWQIGIGAAAVILAAALGYLWLRPPESVDARWSPKGQTVSMAVVRFADRNLDERQIGAGLVDEMMSDLSRIDRLRVMYRTADPDEDPCTLAQSLDAETLLTGSVQTDNERIRVAYQWFAAEDCQLILSNSHEAHLGNVFEVQTAISKAIVGRLALALDTPLDTRSMFAPPSTPGLYPEILVGRTYLDIGRNDLRRRGAEPIRRSIRIFEQAVREDPNLVSAHLRLAEAYAVLPSYTGADRQEMYARSLAALDEVTRLDGTPIRTYATRAQIHAARFEFDEAMKMFQLAVDYTPSDGYVRQWYSVFLSTVGYLDQSLAQAKIAADLDPTSPVNIHRLAIAYLWMDENEQAARYFALAQSVGIDAYVNPEPYSILLMRQRRYEELEDWMRTIQRAQELPSDWLPTVLAAVREPGPEMVSRAMTALDGAWRDQELSPRLYWGLLIVLQQSQHALDATLQNMASGNAVDDLQFLFTRESRFLRAMPGFATIVRRAGLDRFWDEHGWPDACRRAGGEIRCS